VGGGGRRACWTLAERFVFVEGEPGMWCIGGAMGKGGTELEIINVCWEGRKRTCVFRVSREMKGSAWPVLWSS